MSLHLTDVSLTVLFGFIAFAAAMCAARYRDWFRKSDQRANALQTRLDGVELELLGLRIRPHFLFNTLNAVSGLMHEDVDAADEMLPALGAPASTTTRCTRSTSTRWTTCSNRWGANAFARRSPARASALR